MEIKKNELYDVLITGMTNEGNGVGKLDGYTVFIPDTAIGDYCRIKLVKCNKTYGYGILDKIIDASPDRIEADCKSMSQCGGCVFRHISYEAELKIKENFVRDAFERIGNLQVPVLSPIVGSPKVSGYRNKAQYPVGKDKNGNLISGFYASHSHRIVPSEECDLQPLIFARIQSKILQLIKQNNISVYDSITGKGLVRHIYLRIAEATDEIMVCLVVTSCKDKKLARLAAELKESFSEISSIILNENSQMTNVILGKRCITLEGTDTITDILCGVHVKLSALSFYQVNHDQAEALYKKAIEYAAPDSSDILLDLYCGAGTIGLSAAKFVKEVIGVEIIPEAVEDAKENARINQIHNARFICSDAGQAAKKLAEEGIRPDIIIVDPPRKGLDQDVIDAIIKMSPSRLVMVSCNPATAARDAALLHSQGYVINAITPVDMFPRTAHVECVCLLKRI